MIAERMNLCLTPFLKTKNKRKHAKVKDD